MIPQIIWIVLAVGSLMIASYEHGKPKTGHNNVWLTITSTILMCALLYWGGFFDCMFK